MATQIIRDQNNFFKVNSSSKKIRFGIIGCSRVVKKSMVRAMDNSVLAELAAIGSRSGEKALEFCLTASELAQAGRQARGAVYGTYDEVINNNEVDAVYVSLPNALHEEWAIKAARAGKHVLCEKSAATSYAAAKKMVESCKQNDVRLMEGFMFRYHPQHQEIRRMIESGVLGDLLKFNGCFAYPMPEDGSNVMNKDLGGGSLNDSACYPVCASRMIFREEPLSAVCSLKIDAQKGIDTKADILLVYPGGKSAFVSSAFGSCFQSTYSVLGSRARAEAKRAYAVPFDMAVKIILDTGDRSDEVTIGPADHFKLMVDDFCGEILKGKKSEKNFEEDLLAQAKVLEAARVSHGEKRIVNIGEIE